MKTLKFRAFIPDLNLYIENPAIYPDSKMIGISYEDLKKLLDGKFFIEDDCDSFGYSEIRPLDYYENDDAECIMKILGTDFEWFNFEDGFELQMSIDGGEFEPFHLID